jgi:hypothetical protein
MERERERLVILLSSIVAKRRRREENPKRESKGMRDGYQRNTEQVFIAVKCHGATVTDAILIPMRPQARSLH